MNRIETYLQELNGAQRDAVLENERPLLVLAGAGSGKTRVITTKIAYAIEVLGLQPWEILAVTFTNRAAKEMKSRVEQMLDGIDISEMHIRTFHSFGAWLLRRYGASIGLSNTFSIYDDDDSLSLLSSCFPTSKKAELVPIAKAISLAKDMALDPDSPQLADFRRDPHFRNQFKRYEERLRQVGNVDFADLIGRAVELLEQDQRVSAMLHRRFKMVLVDEYQDSNISQFKLLQTLVGPQTFVCVVGDDDQSIYRFRGAEVENILSFPDVFPNTRIVKLEQNYRSTSNILALASKIIARNTGRHPKTLWTDQERGEPCKLIYVSDERAEALRVAAELRKGGDYSNAAILYRTNAQSSTFETLFTQSGIPYKVIGALRFYDREEVKDALALLYLLLNRKDEVNFKRMVNKPTRGIGKVSLDKILSLAAEHQLDLIAALHRGSQEGVLSSKAAASAQQFAFMFDEAERRIDKGNAELIRYMLEESGLINYYQEQDNRNHTEKLDNLGNLASTLKEYPPGREGLTLYLESLTLDRTMLGHKDPADQPGVSLITMHNTKGLEFDRVFITGLEEGLFPGGGHKNDADIEEERRIFYVAITRARKELFLLCCKRRTLWGKTSYQTSSRFLSEIPKNMVEIEGASVVKATGSALDVKRQRSDAFGGAVRKGMGRNANIILAPVKQFVQPKNERKNTNASFTLGDRVFHQDFGEGEVQNLKSLRGREMVEVRFASGKRTTFFTDAVQLEKLARD
ncbi:MAG: UvrD-helicase domain-containing protein [Sphaerochaetaceae bacterium]|nr:UvrD-helicase domain-containing protein [Sphaerochaetaceae bacterium]